MAAAFVLGEVYAAGYIGLGSFGLVVFAVFFAFKLFYQKERILRWEGALLLVCVLLGGYRFLAEEGKRSYGELVKEEASVEIRGRVDWVKETAYGAVILLSEAEIRGGEAAGLRLSVSLSDASDLLPGDRIQARGRLEEFARAGNPGEFDSYLYYRSLGCHYAYAADEITAVKKAKLPVYRFLMAARGRLREIYQTICTKEASGIYQAMLLGEKEELFAETKELYSDGGISHILAISGLHIAVLGMGLYRMLRKVGGFRFSGIIAGAVIWLYVLMTGSAVSAQRACLMFLIQLFSYMIGRSYDMLSAAAAALLILLWRNPWYIFNSGCQLSFGAVFAVGLLLPVLKELFEFRAPWFQALLASVSVSLATFPVLAGSFYEISPYSVLLNLIVIPCMTLVMLSGLLGGLSGLFHPFAGRFFIALGQYILLVYDALCRFCRFIPGNQMITGKPPVAAVLGYYLALGAVLLVFKNIKLQKGAQGIKKLVLAGILVLLPAILCIRVQRSFYVCFLNVSQGDGIYMETPDGIRILVDGGSSDKRNLYQKSLLPFLKARGVRTLDYAVVTHPDEDHVSALKELMEEGEIRIKRLMLPEIDGALWDEAYLELIGLADRGGIAVSFLRAGDTLRAGELVAACLYPYKGLMTEDRNGYSTVLDIRYRGFSMLLTGDLGEEGERYLINHMVREREAYTVLKVAHHGSRFSTCEEFLDRITAEYAVISSGKKNRYGHPHEETLQRLEEAGIIVLKTAEMGAIEWEE